MNTINNLSSLTYSQKQGFKKNSSNQINQTSKTDKQDTVKISGKQNNTAKTIAIASGTFLAGGLISTLIFKGRYSTLKREVGGKIEKAVEKAITPYKDELAATKNKLCSIIEAKTSTEVDEKLLDLTRKDINDYKLDYDPTTPLRHLKKEQQYDNAFSLDDFKPTSNRANMRELSIPSFSDNKSWRFELPETSDMKPVQEQNIKFTPHSTETNMSVEYANSVQWDDDKISRDLLQNFYDGHGHTLDGVKVSADKLSNGNFKVRIEGKGIYSPDKAILLGETSKRYDAEAAGNYGEGLKMTVLKILKDKGAQTFETGSDGWKVTYKIEDSKKMANKKVLAYSLENATNHNNGNFIEFETNQTGIIESIRNTINRFYHSSNPDFKCPDFENSLFGIKQLDKKGMGGIYIAGQKFEYDGSWDNVEGATVFFKKKPPISAKLAKYDKEETKIFDPSRDRISIKRDDLERIAKYFALDEKMTDQEVVFALRSIEKLWTNLDDGEKGGTALLKGLLEGAKLRYIHIKFPNEYLCLPRYGVPDIKTLQELRSNGFKICNENFESLGMPTVNDYLRDAKNHNCFTPTETEIKKIGIIKKALQKFRPYVENEKMFDSSELNPEIFLFNGKGENESKTYRDTLAEALIKFDENTFRRKSVGFWVDREYLSKASFAEILSTSLHEITHKAGGDGTSDFSYKLTDVLEKEIASRLDDKFANIELGNLRKVWDELSSK